MNKQITITINEDGIWGDTELDGIDTIASESKLEQMVADAVAKEYGYTTEVSIENIHNTKVGGLDEYEDADEIEGIGQTISDVWETWQWVVDK